MSNLGYLEPFMRLALKEALIAYKNDEVPVGAIIVKNGVVCGTGRNQVIEKGSVVSHAEINAINQASKFLKNYRLIDCDLYVTLEPCHMCAKAIADARIRNLYFGACEPKMGSIISIDNFLDSSHLNHRVSYSFGYLQDDSRKLLQDFFRNKRGK